MVPADSEVRVLFVDETSPGTSTAELLERRDGFEVVTTADVETALDRLAGEPFDCVVSGYQLPEGNGIEFLRAVRERYPDLPFVLVTADGSETVAAEAIAAGVTHYVPTGEQDAIAVLADRIADAVDTTRAGPGVDHQEQLDALLAHSPDWVSIIDGNSVVRYNSPACERIVGYEPDELVGEDLREHIHPADRSRVQSAYEKSLADAEKVVTVEYRFRHADGSWCWLEAVGSNQLSNPLIEGYVVNRREVTARKKRERMLEKERRQFRTLAENLPNGAVALFDTDLRYQIVAGGVFDELDLSPSEMRWRRLEDVHSAAFEREYLPAYRETLSGERNVFEFEYGDRTFRGWTVPVRDNSGEVIAGMAMTQDITERRRRERRLEQQNERLEEFSHIVSHDLRNPLEVARSSLQLVREDRDDERLEAVARAHGRMERLIDDLLALARTGETGVETTTVDLGERARTSWDHVETGAATLAVETDRVIRADPDRLGQLFENLFRNAVEHGSTSADSGARQDAVEHGSTDSRNAPRSDDTTEHGDVVTVRVGDCDGGFYVADDGPGIPPAERDRVFDVGYSTNPDGTGFGLNIVENVADAHDWTVRVTDAADGGARFEFTGADVETA